MECSLGFYTDKTIKIPRGSLNPYSNGMLTWKKENGFPKLLWINVLILILMECSLGQHKCQYVQNLKL